MKCTTIFLMQNDMTITYEKLHIVVIVELVQSDT